MKVLWTGEYDENYEKEFNERFDEVTKGSNCIEMRIENTWKADRTAEELNGTDLFIVGYDAIDKNVIAKNPDLKMILSVRDGPEDNIDIEACTEAGLPVLFAGGRCVHSVAELNLTIMFNLASKYILMNDHMRDNKKWDANYVEPLSFTKTELFRKTLSIIGLGRNGKQLAQMANGIGMRVVAYDPYVTKEQADALNVEMMSLDEAMAEGDYVTLLARVTPETTGMITAEKIALMKPTAYLINTGRPKLTDTDAILDAIDNGVIQGAALDVFPWEPMPDGHRVFDYPADKLLISPHIAGMSRERVPHQYEYLMEAYDKFLNGDREGLRLYNPKVFDSPKFEERGGKLWNLNNK
ncbi:MAG: hypothetical protein IKE38_02565 [Erysipelotrichaceae bacterium]|nr:hypothetical protein [Erysipelotrichaceae bacterium]